MDNWYDNGGFLQSATTLEPRVSPAGLFQFMNSDPQVSNKHWDNL